MPQERAAIWWCEGGCGLVAEIAVAGGRCASCGAAVRSPAGRELTSVLVRRLSEFVGHERAEAAANELARGERATLDATLADLERAERRAKETALLLETLAR